MKICFISHANNYHTIKWCKWFSERGHEVHVISFSEGMINGAYVHWINVGVETQGNDGQKLKYLLGGRRIRKMVEEIRPEIIHVHYATSYGTAVALSGISGYCLSVWGSDVYDFPKKGIFHELMLKYSLNKAAYLFSTSQAMAKEARKYTNKPFSITPFGVDMDLFSPAQKSRKKTQNTEFIVGTVKGLYPKYGIDYLIKAVALVHKRQPEIPIRLRIAGKGTYEKEYRQLAEKEGVGEITTWLGFISQEQAAQEWADMDIAVIYSTLESESFGVSAVEAQACGTPVIISDIPGLMEATIPGVTSEVVSRMNPELLSEAITVLYGDSDKRNEMGKAGRAFVEKHFELNKCFDSVTEIYQRIYGGVQLCRIITILLVWIFLNVIHDMRKMPCSGVRRDGGSNG